jgi:2-(1,2-epoxy-1,2-dihydrophenyl)acetyl-CoA isomerase
MDYQTLLYEVRDGVAWITLNRPEAANTVTVEMCNDLMRAALHAGEERAVRVVVLTGAGKSFSAGGDLKAFAAAGDAMASHIKEVTTYLHAAISQLARMDAPVIAAVNGVAAGAGMSLACAADLVIAAESARFTMAYTRAGLTPDGSGTFFLPRIVGLHRALDLVLTNRMLNAREAQEWGIVARVVADDAFAEQVRALAGQLAAGPSHALGAAKRLVRTSFGESLETQMAHESDAIADAMRSADGREGIAAFLQKRPPSFSGS